MGSAGVPSPLVQIKAQLAAAVEDEVVFEVQSDKPLTRWTTAVMNSYDGVVWTVADPNDASTDFRPVGSRLPSPTCSRRPIPSWTRP